MTTYDAGSIKATADLDRDPFIAGLRYCMQQGTEFGRQKFTATAAVDTANARRELEELRLLMRRISDESIDINVNVDSAAARIRLAELRTEQARYRADAALARAEQSRWNAQLGESKVRLEQQRQATMATRSALRDYERQVQSTSRTTQRASQESRHEFSLLRAAIEQLGPPLIPIAGAAIAGGAALAGMGVAGILAVKGITAEYKAGTPLGLKYAAGVRGIKDELGALEHTAAGGVLTGFQAAQAKMLAQYPAFNREVATSSRLLGDTAQHLVGGLVGGFTTFGPLIHTIEGDVDSLAARFEAWATGSGGAKFAQTLLTDYGHVKDFLGELGPALSHIFSAVDPLGSGMLDNLTMLLGIIRSIPVPILRAAATAYIAWRTALLVTGPLTAAAKALEGLKTAQLGAAASTTVLARAQAGAGGWGATTLYGAGAAANAAERNAGFLARSAGFVATATRAVVPYAAAWVAASLALSAASNATERWRHSVDGAKSSTANFLHAFSSLSHFDIGGAMQARRDQSIAEQNAQSQREAQNQLNRFGVGPSSAPGFDPFAKKQDAPQFTAGGYADVVAKNAAAMARARAEWQAGIGTMHALTAAGADQGAEFDALAARTQAAAAAYQSLKEHQEFYRRGLMDLQREQRTNDRDLAGSRDAYRGANVSRLQGNQTIALTQNPTLTAGVSALQQYAKGVESARKAEEVWTKVTDDNTVTIRGVKFETAAYNAALDQTHGNVAKAAGLLLGHSKALEDDQRAAAEAAKMQDRLSGAIGAAERKYNLTDQQVNTYAASLGVTTDRLARGVVSQSQFVTMVGRVKDVIDQADTSTAGWVAALQQFEQGADTAASRGNLLAAAMVSMNGTAISYGVTMSQAASANQQFVNDFGQLHKGIVNLKTGFIDYHNAAAAPVLNDLQSLQTAAAGAAAATYQNEVATRGRTQAAKDAASVYRNDTYNALINERKQLGLTRGEAEKLANRYFHWPKDAKTRLELMGTEGTNKLLNGIGEQLALLTHKPWISTLDADTRTPQAKIKDLQGRINAIRQNRVPGLDANSEAARRKIAELQAAIDRLRSKTITITTITHAPGHAGSAHAVSSAAGNIFRAYGAGGLENHWPQIAKSQPGTVRVWAEPETRGEAYIPLANDWRRPRARDIASATVEMLGGVAFFAAGGGPGGYTGVTGPSSGGGSGGGSGGSGGSGGGSSSSKTQSLLNSLKTLARQVAADALGLKTYAELDKLSSTTLEGYAAGLLKQVQRAHDLKSVPSELVKRVKAENAELTKELRVRDRLATQRQAADQKLADARRNYNAEVGTVSQANMGSFNVTSSGQGYAYGIKATLEQQLADTKRFQTDLAKARHMHLDPRLVRQFAEQGPDSMQNLEAIINAGQAYINDINKDYSSLATAAKGTGTAQANAMGLDDKVATALRAQEKIAHKQHEEQRRMNHILGQLRGDLHTLKDDIATSRRHAGKGR